MCKKVSISEHGADVRGGGLDGTEKNLPEVWYMLSRKYALVFIVFVLLSLFAGNAFAVVTGECVNCHTMHNSQDNLAMRYDQAGLPAGTSPPTDTLLRATCVGCHSNPDSAETIIMLGDSRVPIVHNPNHEPTNPLAGGNFYWVGNATYGDAYGHNVYGISGIDVAHATGGAPGGMGPGIPPSNDCYHCHTTLATADNGCNGCHQAAHHADDGLDNVTGQGDGWYRFLGDAMIRTLARPGVTGVEDPDWEQTPSPTQHNVYKGTTIEYTNASSLTTNSIGQFCSGCHNNFHHGDAALGNGSKSLSGAWVRHPSDVVLPSDANKEYQYYTTYNPLAPVAKPTIASTTVTDEVVPGVDVVTCISCHRPHGSPNPDMLRWDYLNDCEAGTTDAGQSADCGCFACHTTKDGI